MWKCLTWKKYSISVKKQKKKNIYINGNGYARPNQYKIKTNLVLYDLLFFPAWLGEEKTAITAHSRLTVNLWQINEAIDLLL